MNFFNNVRLINKVNVTKQIKPIKDELLKDAYFSQYNRRDEYGAFNFEVNTNYRQYLYDVFIKHSRRLLNNFTLRDTDFKVWCYLTGENFSLGDTWHNHLNTSTINGVLYLNVVKGCGIEFKTDYNETYKQNIPDRPFNRDNVKYIEPNNFDLLIFPNFIDHRPLISKDKTRISFNLELRCNESSKKIFNLRSE